MSTGNRTILQAMMDGFPTADEILDGKRPEGIIDIVILADLLGRWEKVTDRNYQVVTEWLSPEMREFLVKRGYSVVSRNLNLSWGNDVELCDISLNK